MVMWAVGRIGKVFLGDMWVTLWIRWWVRVVVVLKVWLLGDAGVWGAGVEKVGWGMGFGGVWNVGALCYVGKVFRGRVGWLGSVYGKCSGCSRENGVECGC